MRVFVTGATGFVGTHLLPVLVASGHEVHALVRSTEQANAVLLSGVHATTIGSLDDEATLATALRSCEAVLHLAALVSFRKRDRERMFQVNAVAAARLAQVAKREGVQRFVHVSSVAAVGKSRRPVVLDESHAWPAKGSGIGYCDSKRRGEDLVFAEATPGFDVVVVNPSSMFGPGDRRKAEGSLVDRVARNKLPFCPSGGACFADVRDVARGIVAALDRGRSGERYILGGENLSGRELITKIATASGGRVPRWTLPDIALAALQAVQHCLEVWRSPRGPLTAELIALSRGYSWYSSAKAERELDYSYQPIDEALRAVHASLRGARSDTMRP